MNSKVLHNATKQNYGNRTSDCSFHDCSKIGPSNIHFVYADANCERQGLVILIVQEITKGTLNSVVDLS